MRVKNWKICGIKLSSFMLYSGLNPLVLESLYTQKLTVSTGLHKDIHWATSMSASARRESVDPLLTRV